MYILTYRVAKHLRISEVDKKNIKEVFQTESKILYYMYFGMSYNNIVFFFTYFKTYTYI